MRKTQMCILMLLVMLIFTFSCSEDSTSSDTQPPTVAITYPANNSEITQGNVVTITAEAEDNEGVKEVRFYINGEFEYLDEEEPYQYEWDTGEVRNIDCTIYAKAFDTNGNSTTSDVVTVTINEPVGYAPNPPSNPNPAHNAISIYTGVNLSWDCSDPDPDDILTYDVYFGTSPNPSLVNSEQSGTTYDPGTLNDETTYYWKIVAHDDHSNSTTGDIWQFTTGAFGTVTDIDGNVYQTLVIGDQEWMIENLKVTHYNNGDPIPNLTNDNDWTSTNSGAYCAYDNNESNADTYGYLYNWFAVDDERGLAPEGWHVPTDDEIKQLEMHLGMSQSEADEIGYRGTNQGSQLAGNAALWSDGDLENDPEFGSSGFDFLPGGYRNFNDGNFYYMGYSGFFWSATETNTDSAWSRYLGCNGTGVYRYCNSRRYGFSVRCIRSVE